MDASFPHNGEDGHLGNDSAIEEIKLRVKTNIKSSEDGTYLYGLQSPMFKYLFYYEESLETTSTPSQLVGEGHVIICRLDLLLDENEERPCVNTKLKANVSSGSQMGLATVAFLVENVFELDYEEDKEDTSQLLISEQDKVAILISSTQAAKFFAVSAANGEDANSPASPASAGICIPCA